MMVIPQVVSTAGGDDVEIMMPFRPSLARGYAGAVEGIVGIVHLIDAEHGFQATLVERLVVGYEREAGYLGLYLLPHFWEDRCIICIGSAQSMHLTAPVVVILRFGFDK